jgi:hypothetical protein
VLHTRDSPKAWSTVDAEVHLKLITLLSSGSYLWYPHEAVSTVRGQERSMARRQLTFLVKFLNKPEDECAKTSRTGQILYDTDTAASTIKS